MLFEDFDKKIKEAADQHHPAYDEKAWQKMETLLNKHLPQQKDDRRRILFSLLLFIIIGGGAYMVIKKPWNKNLASHQLAPENKTKVQATTNEKLNKTNTGSSNTESENLNRNKNIAIAPEGGNINAGNNSIRSSVNKEPKNIRVNNILRKSNTNAGNQNVLLENDNTRDRNIVVTDDTKKNEQKVNFDNPKSEASSNSNSVVNNGENKITNSNNLISKNEVKTNNDEQISKPESKNSHQQKGALNNKNGFSFFVSAGPDVSKAGNSKTGKTTLLYGAGVGYTKNHITLRTGIYASKKIYWAGANDYKLSYVTPPPTKFEGADANCDVIDIPIKLSYAFDVRDKGNLFAGVGLSSYLMKKEKYVYTYKTASSTFYYPYQTSNENRHYFSILNLSAGYTYRINNTISISAEPYAEIPLTGIGVGKVHLNSGGILFTVGIKPFKK